MGKLSTLKPKVGTLKPRVATMRDTRDTAATGNLALYRQWYKSKRWQDLRQAVLVRDLYTCQHTGILLSGKAPAPNSAVVHHKIPHRGDERLFWDINNLESVAKSWHDSEAQAQEKRA